MANRKISDLTALTAPASGDYLPIVDISEAVAADKNKRITIEELFRGVPLGTAAAPAIAIEGDENTGIYSPGADQLAISTNGVQRLSIDPNGIVSTGVNGAGSLVNGSALTLERYTGSDLHSRWATTNVSAGLQLQQTVGTISGGDNIARARVTFSAVSGTYQKGFQWFDDSGNTVLGYAPALGRIYLGDSTNNGTLSSYLASGTNIAGGTLTIAGGQGTGTGAGGPIVFSTAAAGSSGSSVNALTERLRIDSTGQIEASSLGTAAAPVWSFLSDQNTGIYSPGADQLAISTGGTGRLFVSANGLTTLDSGASAYPLDINSSNPYGTVATWKDSNVAFAKVGGAGEGIAGANKNDFGIIYNLTGASRNLIIGSNGTERLRITSAGNVGIGTSSPSATLEVNGTLTTQGNIAAQSGGATRTLTLGPAGAGLEYNTDGTTYLGGRTDAYPLAFRTNSTERLRIDSSGRLLVGTSSSTNTATAVFQGNSSGSTNAGNLWLQRGQAPGSITANSNIGFVAFAANGGETYAEISAASDGTSGAGDYPGRLVFATTADGAGSPTERMRITSAGLVGIGTTNPTQRLDVRGPAAATEYHIGVGDSNLARLLVGYKPGGGAGTANSAAVSADDTGSLNIFTRSGVANNISFGTSTGTGAATERLRITSAGNVGIGTASPAARIHSVVADGAYSFGATGATKGIRFTHSSTLSGIDGVDQTLAASYQPIQITGSDVRFGIQGNEVSRIDSSGRLLVGTSTARANFDNSTVSARLQVEGVGAGNSYMSVIGVGSNNYDTGSIVLGRSAGTAVGANTLVSSGDYVGQVRFMGNDGSEFVEAANITAFVDGTPGANDMPGRLVFSTTADGAATPTERMRISQAGQVSINTTATPGTPFFDGTLRVANSATVTSFRCTGVSGAIVQSAWHEATTGNNQLINFGTETTRLTRGSIYYDRAANGLALNGTTNLVLATNETERLRIDSTGLVTLAGPGIKFPATQVASADPNTLDDYEEGTWTPTIIGSTTAGTATYAVRVGTYTKVGRKVTAHCSLDYSAGTGAGNLQISGLPFTTSAQIFNAFPTLSGVTTTASTIPYAYTQFSVTLVELAQYPTGGGTATNIAYDAAGTIYFTLTYIAA